VIGVCKNCSCTDTLNEGGICEWCAEEDRREHDDPPWDEPDLGEIPDEAQP
jgi:hypothetical protein